MKISAVIVSRNDNYGGYLNERATYALNSAIDTYDEVFYIDWNSENYSLLYNIENDLQLKGNLHHIVIPPSIAKQLTNQDVNAQKCCETLGRNIGLRRATGDWLVSTNIDVIHPSRKDVDEIIKINGDQHMITLSRRETTWEEIKKFHGGEIIFKDWKKLRDHISSTSEKREVYEKITSGDDYSLINCCGDFQLAPKHIWNDIRGFEEDLIYALHSDTNVQKKAVMHGYGLKAIFEPPMFHINHGSKGWGGGGIADGVNKKSNDIHRAVTFQDTTQNLDTWGFSDIEIEFETL